LAQTVILYNWVPLTALKKVKPEKAANLEFSRFSESEIEYQKTQDIVVNQFFYKLRFSPDFAVFHYSISSVIL